MSVNLKDEVKSLEQRAYEVIKDMILSGDLKQNTRLTEEKMAEELGVSRTPIKKAFIRLKEEYLLEEAPSQGLQVKLSTVNEALDAYEARESLEGLAAKRAIDALSEKSVSKMIKDFERLLKAGDKMDINEFERLNFNFHKMIVDCFENKSITKFAVTLMMQTRAFHQRYAIKFFYAEDSVQEHLDVLYAIKNKNEAEVEGLQRKHIKNIRKYFVKAIRNIPDLQEAAGPSR